MHRSTSAGFTLIETLVTVALVSVLAGVAVPLVAQGIERYNMISASQQVASTIRAARFQAVAQNKTHYVRFNFPADGQYQMRRENAGVEEDAGDAQTLPDGVTFSDGAVDVEFTTSGRAMAASMATVTNGNSSQNRTISVTTGGQVQLTTGGGGVEAQ